MSGETLAEVFEEIYDLIRDCAWDKLDAMLDAVDVETQSIETLVGYLSASNPGKRYLAGRVRFIERIEARFRVDGVGDVDGLLRGLR